MAKIQHLHSITSGAVPTSLLRGQVAINIPDQIIYAPTPDGQVSEISKGIPGLANATSFLSVHIPVLYHPVAQFAPGYTSSQVGAKFQISAGTATLSCVPVFALGKLWYVQDGISCPTTPSGAYQLTIDTVARTTSIIGLTTPLPSNSGTINPLTGLVSLVFYSEGTNIQPWFYLPQWEAADTLGNIPIFRISLVQTFGAIPVSAGFPGAAATSYWGHP